MPVDPSVKQLSPVYDRFTEERVLLGHARQQADALGLDDYFIVDVDSHREPDAAWGEVLEYVDNPVMKRNAQHDLESAGVRLYVPHSFPAGAGFGFQPGHGRIFHQEGSLEEIGVEGVDREVALGLRSMDAMGINVQVTFPTTLLGMGMSPLAGAEAHIAYAYNRWMIERFCSQSPRLTFMPYLPMRDVDMCRRIVRETADQPGVAGFMVTSIRYQPVHDNSFMDLYAEIEETGLPLAFHAGPTWDDDWMKTMNRFISVHALSFVHCNLVHCTNWVINGLPERFPGLNVVWLESGLAWVPFLMQRLDHEYLKRTSEAPLLKRLPSDYMRDMYFASQPMEMDNLELLESTMTAIRAETQLLYASDWPHWDFDLPSSILRFPWLSDKGKRGILGENARRVFRLDPRASSAGKAQVVHSGKAAGGFSSVADAAG